MRRENSGCQLGEHIQDEARIFRGASGAGILKSPRVARLELHFLCTPLRGVLLWLLSPRVARLELHPSHVVHMGCPALRRPPVVHLVALNRPVDFLMFTDWACGLPRVHLLVSPCVQGQPGREGIPCVEESRPRS